MQVAESRRRLVVAESSSSFYATARRFYNGSNFLSLNWTLHSKRKWALLQFFFGMGASCMLVLVLATAWQPGPETALSQPDANLEAFAHWQSEKIQSNFICLCPSIICKLQPLKAGHNHALHLQCKRTDLGRQNNALLHLRINWEQINKWLFK